MDARIRKSARGAFGPLGLAALRPSGPHWRLDYLFSVGMVSWPVHIVVTGLAATVLAMDGGQWAPGWWLAMLVLSVFMLGLCLSYRLPGRRIADPEVYGWVHSGLTTIIGLVWGNGAFFAAAQSPEMLTFYSLVLGGTALAAISSQHALPRSAMLSVWTSVPLLALAHLMPGAGLQPVATATMMILFGAILTIVARRLESFMGQNVAMASELEQRIDELTLTTAELREAQLEKSRFLAQASHDLRQPIHAIGLFVECLDGMRLGREGRDILRNVNLSLDSLARLCRSLLDLSALDVGKVRPVAAHFAIDDVIAEVVRQAEETARASGVTLKRVPSRAWSRTDPALLHTMLQNLVSNAVKYAPGTEVLVGVRRAGGRLAIDVVDRGPGISEVDRRRVFKEFVQLGRTARERAGGLGLGLSIVKRLAELLGLSVELSSRPGAGSRFRILGLEPAAPGKASAAARNPAMHERRLHGLRVLVLDDDQNVRESTEKVLSRWGCEVTAMAAAPDAGWAAANCDVLLCDQELDGELTGYDFIEAVRRAAGRPLAAALVTGANIDMLLSLTEGRNVAVLAKPVRPAQLRSVLLAAVTGRSMMVPAE